MAGASMNDIKARIKSVQSTMQITKAMELVATSKLRRAKETVERTRPYTKVLSEAMTDIISGSEHFESEWFMKKEISHKSLLKNIKRMGKASSYAFVIAISVASGFNLSVVFSCVSFLVGGELNCQSLAL